MLIPAGAEQEPNLSSWTGHHRLTWRQLVWPGVPLHLEAPAIAAVLHLRPQVAPPTVSERFLQGTCTTQVMSCFGSIYGIVTDQETHNERQLVNMAKRIQDLHSLLMKVRTAPIKERQS